ncbi:MAG: transglycosylase SLT domain-containing protein [Candidatus Woesearchaeota archaeon]
MKLKNLKKCLAVSAVLSASALSNLYHSPYSDKNNTINNPQSSLITNARDTTENSIKYYATMATYSLVSVLHNPKNYIFPNLDIIFDIVRHDFNTNNDGTLDSLITKAKDVLNISSIENEYAYPIILQHIDTLPARKKVSNELLVDTILDTTNTGSIIVDKYFIKASIEEESTYKIKAYSSAKANGLMQITPKAWKKFGEGNYSNIINPVKNIRAGIKYYLWLEEFIASEYAGWHFSSIENKRELLLAAYNGGPYRLKNNNFDISKMPEESKTHVNKVINTMNRLHNEDLFIKLASYINNNEDKILQDNARKY